MSSTSQVQKSSTGDGAPREPLIPRLIAMVLSWSIVRAYLRYSQRKGSVLADSITYRTLFGLFAAVLLGFSVAALWLAGNPTAWNALIEAIDNAIPGLVGGDDPLIDVDEIDGGATFSVAGGLSLLGLVGAAIGVIGTLRVAMRQIAGTVVDDVLFIWVILRNLALAAGAGGALLASAAATMLGTAGLGLVAGWFGMAEDDTLLRWGSRGVALLVTFALDTVAVAVLFRALSGVKASGSALWSGALLGGFGLTVLQQLSGLFVGGASSNPLLASFASLIALLLWINLSAQVILIASAFIVTKTAEKRDRVRERFGARTFAQLRVLRAEDAVISTSRELQAARDAESVERAKA